MREIIKTQYPIIIDIEYDLNVNAGIIYNLNLHNDKTLTHIHIYMHTLYGISIKIQNEEEENKKIIFDKDCIYVNFTEKNHTLSNVIVEINNKNTFMNFIKMFKDDFFYLKHAHKNIKYYDNDSELYGIEIEMIMDDLHNNFQDRNNLLKKLEQKYKKQIYCCTEDFGNHFIEINNYPMNIKNFYKLYWVIKFLENNGMTFNDTSNIHIHINKNMLGSDIAEIKKNINKLLVYFYNIDDFIYNEMSTNTVDNLKVCSTIKYIVDKYIGFFNYKNVLQDLMNKSEIINKSERPPRLNYYRLLSEFEEEKTFEFRLSTILNSDKDSFFKLICFVEYCIKIVINKTLKEVNDLTIEDFLNYYNSKKDFIYNITDF